VQAMSDSEYTAERIIQTDQDGPTTLEELQRLAQLAPAEYQIKFDTCKQLVARKHDLSTVLAALNDPNGLWHQLRRAHSIFGISLDMFADYELIVQREKENNPLKVEERMFGDHEFKSVDDIEIVQAFSNAFTDPLPSEPLRWNELRNCASGQ